MLISKNISERIIKNEGKNVKGSITFCRQPWNFTVSKMPVT